MSKNHLEEIEKTIRDLFHEPEKLVDKVEHTFRSRPCIPADKWSPMNQLLMECAGSIDCRGYRQWQKAGRHVKRGAKAVWILGPMTKKVEQSDLADDSEDTKAARIIGFRAIAVFRYEDTEGDAIDHGETPPADPPPLMDVAEAMGQTVRYSGGNGGAYGWYCPERGEIMLKSDTWQVFFHELAHVAHDRLLRQEDKALKTGQDGFQETVAELTALVLAKRYQVECPAFATHYIRQYAGMQLRDMAAVMKTVHSVLGMIASVQTQVTL